MRGAQPGQLGAQRVVVGLPVSRAAFVDFDRVGLLAVQVQVLLAKGVQRQQAGRVLPGVEVAVLGRTVQVDHVARVRGHQRARAHRTHEVVEPRQVPVGVGAQQCGRRHALRDAQRDVGSGMGERHQQRDVARGQRAGVGSHGEVV